MKIIKWDTHDIKLRLSLMKNWPSQDIRKVQKEIEGIIDNIMAHGDIALFNYTKLFESYKIDKNTVRVSRNDLDLAWNKVSVSDRRIIQFAAKRIERFHKKQLPRSFKLKKDQQEILEQRIMPLTRVGICIPAGKAPLFSTVLMTAIPAKIAGVREIAMISPWPNGKMNPYILAAAKVAGISEIYKVGGAQGVAALACGTQSIAKVDKIVGPGNIWVSYAKSMVAREGWVDIDTVAGPSEIVVIADKSCPPSFIAADLLSQLEHGDDSRAILITPDYQCANSVLKEIQMQKELYGKQKYLKRAREFLAIAIITKDLEEALEAANWLSPEHLEILVEAPRRVLSKIRNAASIFIGPYSPVPIGDYLAGPNHVLPTEGRARFASPLGVEDFVKRQSVVEFSKEALMKLGPIAERMAELEGLDGHAAAIRIRRESLSKKKKV